MADAIVQSGSFTSDGVRKVLKIRSDFDKFVVWNYNNVGGATNPGQGIQFVWQKGMANGTGISIINTDGAATLESVKLAAPNGFYRYDNDDAVTYDAEIAFTQFSDVAQPQVDTGSVKAADTGKVARLFQRADIAAVNGGPMLGFDVQIGTVVVDTSWTFAYAAATAPAIGAVGNAGRYQIVNNLPAWRPYHLFNISQAANALVTCSTDHFLEVGDVVEFKVSSANGMTEINGQSATVLTVPAANTFTIDINTTGYTAFKTPTAAEFTTALNNKDYIEHATVSPVRQNINLIAMVLPANANGLTPGGTSGDVMYWQAIKSFNQ